VPVKTQKNIENKFKKSLLSLLKEIAKSIRLDMIEFEINKSKILIKNYINYQEHRALIHAIGHSNILP